MKYNLSTHGLYILSGAPASGKSTWVKNVLNLPASALMSTDDMREQLFGARPISSSERDYVTRFSGNDKLVFETLANFVRARLQQKMITVIDATNTTNKDREFWAKIAQECGVPSTVILFDVSKEELLARDAVRRTPVGEKVITHFLNKLERRSSLPIIRVAQGDTFEVTAPQLPHSKIDVIGDSHGLLTDLIQVTTRLGYSLDDHGLLTHPNDRKILFLGDWLDRGHDSVECLRLVHHNCVRGGHFAVIGNHEHKLIRAYHGWAKNDTYAPLSFSSAETMVRLWKTVPRKTLDNLMDWMHRLPLVYQYDRFFFCHADIRSLDVGNTPGHVLLYGESDWGKIDSDMDFSRWSLKQPNQPILIRGHIPPTNEVATHAFSLERHVGFKGVMMALPLDRAIEDIQAGKTPSEAVHGNTLSHQTTFDFKTYQTQTMSLTFGLTDLTEAGFLQKTREPHYGLTLYNEGNLMDSKLLSNIEELEKQKMITHKTDESGLSIYKYSKRVFFDGLWGESDLLLHARGLVLDPAGNIVQNPFIKVFNYGERGAGANLPDSLCVEAIEKLNGFLGCVTKHPFKPNSLLVTTTGSFDSDFVQYIKDFITPAKEQEMLEYLSKEDKTLMFEVIHPDDPHIIHYTKEQQGLYLIGARGKTLQAPIMPERELDELGKALGLRRPKHYRTTLGSLRKRVDEVQHEGYMVRDLETGECLLKFKTAHYLTVKFLGRMGAGQIKLMFENPSVFKQKVDEEYYPLVDLLNKNSTAEDFGGMKPEARVPYVRELVHTMWRDIKGQNKTKFSM